MISACTLDCPDACSLLVQSGPNGHEVRGNPDHPFTRGFTCGKIQGYFQRLHSPDRILWPMLRYKSRWQEISWEDALEICSQRLDAACQENPASIVHISGHGARGISKMVVDGFFAALGCTRLQGSVCDGTGIEASILDFGRLDQSPLQDMHNSRWIVNWGRDVLRSSIHTHRIMARARQNGTRVVSIWPGGDGYDRFSDQLIRIAPGGDRFLALAVLKVIWEQGRISRQAVESTLGWEDLLSLIQSYSLSELSDICDVPPKDIYYLAAAYSQSPVATVIGWGVQRHRFGGETVRCIDALAWLSGNVGMSGAGVFYNISSVRNFDLSWLPDKTARFLTLPRLGRELQENGDPPLSLTWINGTNPVNQLPESTRVAQALRDMEFTVVVDGFWTDTALCADLVLPCTLMGEEEDVLGSCMHDYVNRAQAAVDPPPGVRSDLWIIQELNERLGLGLAITDRETCLKRSLALPGEGDQQWASLRDDGYVLAREQKPAFIHGPGHKDGLFHALSKVSPGSQEDPRFPFRLLSLIRKQAIHSQILPLDQDMPPTVWVNPQAPGLQGLDLEGEVFLVSELGRLRVRVAFDSSLHPQALVYRRGDWMVLGGGVNQLIRDDVTDLKVGAAQYSQRVGLRNG
ncbi:MAG: molybdopterin-dependent oxidoreductase [Desulfovermiculus sp.]|nr:molybdopterin-dependent oxidoreductase [Desulfovermiculus sp.]